MTDSYNVIVLGLGAMGSSTAYELSRRGLRVLGLDQYPPGHTHGSSHGDSRIIRELYYEGSLYVPLLQRAYTLWEELERASGASLLRITGGVMLGVPDAHVVKGSRQTAEQLGLPYENLTAAEIRKRFPAMDPPDDFEGVWDARGGYLRPEAAIAAYLELASRRGARFEIGQPGREVGAGRRGCDRHDWRPAVSGGPARAGGRILDHAAGAGSPSADHDRAAGPGLVRSGECPGGLA